MNRIAMIRIALRIKNEIGTIRIATGMTGKPMTSG